MDMAVALGTMEGPKYILITDISNRIGNKVLWKIKRVHVFDHG